MAESHAPQANGVAPDRSEGYQSCMQTALAHRQRTGAALAATAILSLAMLAPAHSQTLRIGLLAPLTGPTAILGQQANGGAAAAAASLGVELDVQNDACTAESGADAARHFIDAKAVAVIGFLCTESLEAALPILKDAGIPAITIGVRTDSITDRREKTGWPVYRLAPRGDAEANAATAIIPKLWRETPFAIIDDGTIANRDLAEQLRAAAEEAGVKPVLVDGFRPAQDDQAQLIKKLRDTGAEAVFISGDASDVSIIAKAAAKHRIAVAGGDTLRMAAGLPVGTLMIGLPEWRDMAAPNALAILDTRGLLPDGYVLPAFAAVQTVAEATQVETTAAHSMVVRIGLVDATTAIGPVSFDAKGDLVPSPYSIFRFDGSRFVPSEIE